MDITKSIVNLIPGISRLLSFQLAPLELIKSNSSFGENPIKWPLKGGKGHWFIKSV
jgi:hypothetical protein